MHLLNIEDLATADILRVLDRAAQWEAGQAASRVNKKRPTCLSYFAQPSTRTRLSTEAAVARLGASVISAGDMTQLRKESLSDFLNCVQEYCDLIAIRHPDHASVVESAANIQVPILNCGTGATSHPTQCLADLYFIWRTFNHLDGVRILLLGDWQLRASRSLLAIRNAFGLTIDVCSPLLSEKPQARLDCESIYGVATVPFQELRDALPNYDVVYVKPITTIDYLGATLEFAPPPVDTIPLLRAQDVAQCMRPNSVVIHALPRFGELDPDIDRLPQARYFELARRAIYPRIAVVEFLLAGAC